MLCSQYSRHVAPHPVRVFTSQDLLILIPLWFLHSSRITRWISFRQAWRPVLLFFFCLPFSTGLFSAALLVPVNAVSIGRSGLIVLFLETRLSLPPFVLPVFSLHRLEPPGMVTEHRPTLPSASQVIKGIPFPLFFPLLR